MRGLKKYKKRLDIRNASLIQHHSYETQIAPEYTRLQAASGAMSSKLNTMV